MTTLVLLLHTILTLVNQALSTSATILMINTIIEDTNNLTIDELSIVWACILYKGHGKNKFSDRSYRTISTCPFFCKAIDSYTSDLYSPTWSQQTAETQFQQKASSHDLAALTLTETITHSVKSLFRPVYVAKEVLLI